MTTYHTIEVGGTEIFYRRAGDPAAPTLLALHGFPSSSAQYERLAGLLAGDLQVVAPDLPGFGQSPPLHGPMTFDGLADAIEAFTEALELRDYSLYMFDFGAPVGFRLAVRHPERVANLVIQNGNAYEAGLGPGMQAIMPYWTDRAAHEQTMRGLLSLEVTRSQYLDGVADPTTVNPDLWELDQRYLELPGREAAMLDLLYDYRTNVQRYPEWQAYLRAHRPPTLLAWGRNDGFFPPAGAEAYLADLPDAEPHLLDTGHFATATHSGEIARLIAGFFAARAG